MDPLCLLGIGAFPGHSQSRNCIDSSETLKPASPKEQRSSENKRMVPSQPYDGTYILIPSPSALGMVHRSASAAIHGHRWLYHHPNIHASFSLPCVLK